MAEEKLFDVFTVEKLYATHRVFAESPEEAEQIARANAWEEGPPHEWEPGNIEYVKSVEEVKRAR